MRLDVNVNVNGMYKDCFPLALCMSPTVHTYHSPDTLYNHITFFDK
jgi:hypothetical protein